jgi:hypothetical protein
VAAAEAAAGGVSSDENFILPSWSPFRIKRQRARLPAVCITAASALLLMKISTPNHAEPVCGMQLFVKRNTQLILHTFT